MLMLITYIGIVKPAVVTFKVVKTTVKFTSAPSRKSFGVVFKFVGSFDIFDWSIDFSIFHAWNVKYFNAIYSTEFTILLCMKCEV